MGDGFDFETLIEGLQDLPDRDFRMIFREAIARRLSDLTGAPLAEARAELSACGFLMAAQTLQ